MSRKKAGPRRRSPPGATSRQATERLLAEGLEMQRARDAIGARQRFEEVLRREPRNADALHLLGLLDAQTGRLAEGTVLLQKAVAANPRVSFYRYNLGNALHRLGRHEEAARAFEETLRLQPGVPEALCSLGDALSALGRYADAIPKYRQATGRRPDYAEAHNNLGSALLASGDADGAVESYRRAVSLAPGSFAARSGLGNALMALTRFDEALPELRRALELEPRRAEAMLSLAKVLLLKRESAEGLRWLREVSQVADADVAAYTNAGDLFYHIGEYESAAGAFRQALAKAPGDRSLQVSLGAALSRKGAHAEAESSLREVLAAEPDHPEALLWLGSVCMHLGRFNEAAGLYRQGMELKPSALSARMGLLEARGYEMDTEMVDEMRRLAETAELSTAQAVPLNFTLGRAMDAAGRYEDAFRYFQRANRLKGVEYDLQSHRQRTDRLMHTFSADFFRERRAWGDASRAPILILGMPRSGTTLVEQILASHPQVAAGGELTYLNDLADELAQEIPDREYPEAVAAASRTQTDALGREYLRRLGQHAEGLPRVTDKLPHNFLRLGLIALCLPGATVIHVRRHPLDTCVSIYFQNFQHAHPYSWDLEHLGSHYRQYQRLMAHWREVLPIKLLEVQYEELIAHQEDKTRELLEFCELPWDDRCLRFWETKRVVHTASMWQVRQPIYTGSVARWRHYEAHLDPLKQALGWEESG
ncbi:MAG: tetratricopeptide repeat protein [Gammaproteobacteria bacterium]|nr:tetratricopeptide repeat protein [Gammaproteobacteria bacterium]